MEASSRPARRSLFSGAANDGLDRKSTRLNSSHLVISYAVFCLKKKRKWLSIEAFNLSQSAARVVFCFGQNGSRIIKRPPWLVTRYLGDRARHEFQHAFSTARN